MSITKINTDEWKESDFIYRTFTYRHFISLIRNQEMVFVRPHKWDDPFENFLFKQTIKAQDKEFMGFKSLEKNVVGLCWTLQKETDFGWRVYAPKKDGISIKVKIKTLVTQLNNNRKNLNGRFILGKVKYYPKKGLKRYYENLDFSSSKAIMNEAFARNDLFRKRLEFKHENEFRLVYSGNDIDGRSNKKKFKINANELIDYILLDPRMSEEKTEKIKEEIKLLGINAPSRQSELYRIPNLELKINKAL